MAKNDFDPNQLVKLNEDLSGLVGRIESLESKFGSHEQIADTLCETTDKASRMKSMLAKAFIDFVQHDHDAKKALKNIVDEADRDAFRLFIKKFGIAVWSIFLIIVSVLITKYFSK